MSEPNTKRELELIAEALDEADDLDVAGARDAVARLGIDVAAWAKDIRAMAAGAAEAERAEGLEGLTAAYQADAARLAARRAEPRRTLEGQQQELRRLVVRASAQGLAGAHFHKFEEATADEVAAMIRSLRHLLGDEDE